MLSTNILAFEWNPIYVSITSRSKVMNQNRPHHIYIYVMFQVPSLEEFFNYHRSEQYKIKRTVWWNPEGTSKKDRRRKKKTAIIEGRNKKRKRKSSTTSKIS